MTNMNRREKQTRARQRNAQLSRAARLVLGNAPLAPWMINRNLLPKRPPTKGPIE